MSPQLAKDWLVRAVLTKSITLGQKSFCVQTVLPRTLTSVFDEPDAKPVLPPRGRRSFYIADDAEPPQLNAAEEHLHFDICIDRGGKFTPKFDPASTPAQIEQHSERGWSIRRQANGDRPSLAQPGVGAPVDP